ncbi:Superfamily II DNA or RNA helicase, SNF2 family [Clostridium amylolyticum]|uniref:Superfamily II DNA or RNA helicase, SNF2 family n=1 Tax=Clostridium amylolyticum TaxID=1121298 RepID=A0A1M6EI63_9CLOT|nr:SNF2 helicase associated domain-containing protein [Clostridium amylolyticum]SHI85000.1 Superfamily II DNA or RNA helicase, SNF2 family [Clostridium amylolyticum]
MMIYDENIIHNYTDNEIYEKGLEYYNKNLVEDFVVQIYSTENSMVNRYGIDTWVHSAFTEAVYNVQIGFNDNSGFTRFHCDCLYFNESYRRKGICKHIASTLFKYYKEKSNLVMEERSAFNGSKFLDNIDNMLNNIHEKKQKLNVKINYHYNNTGRIKSHVEVKVGVNRLYIIKDIERFLEAMEDNIPFKLSKAFQYNSKQHEFKEEHKDLIALFKDIYEFNKISRLSLNYDRGIIKLLDGRKLYIPSRQVERLFKAASNSDINITINTKEIGEVNYYEKDMPLDFCIHRDKEDLVVLPKGDLPISLNDEKSIFYYKEALYKPSKEQIKLYLLLEEALGYEQEPMFKIRQSEGERYASYMLPLLKSISKNIDICNELKDSYIIEDFKAKAYIDKEGSKIKCNLVYTYGDVDIQIPDNTSNNKNELILRDKLKEKNIENVLMELNFKKGKDNFYLQGDESLVYFLKKGVLELQEICEVYYSEGFKTLKLYDYTSIQTNLSINNNNLFKVDFYIKDINKKDIATLFKAIKHNKKYFKLRNGNFIDLENKELQKLVEFIDNIGIKKEQLMEESIELPLYKAFAAEQIKQIDNIENVNINEDLINSLKEIRSFKTLDASVPDNLKGILRDYQVSGYKWLKYLSHMGFGGVLADEMGLGKTLQSIAFLLSEKEKGTSLIVAPTSLLYNWKEELERFAPELKVLIIQGNPEDREELINSIKEYDVVITSYALLRKDADRYKDYGFYCFILDEAQNIKNPYSQNASCTKAIKSRIRFALTGTPIENSLSELWSIFDFIMPGYLMNYNTFISRFQGPISKNVNADALSKLNSLIKPFILRRLKIHVASELPNKIQHKISLDLTKEQKEIYTAYLAAASKKIRKEIDVQGFEKNRIKILGVLTRLRQICCDPSSFIQNYNGESAKISALLEILQQALEENHKVLVFSQFTSVLKNIAFKLDSNNIDYCYLDGSMTSEERVKVVNNFNISNSPMVFLISLKAGGTGLNLTSADIVIHFDPWWNPAVEDQATDRAHRLGQKNSVEVIRLITKGTIEEKIYTLQHKKREIINKVLSEEKHGGFISSFTEGELLELLEI